MKPRTLGGGRRATLAAWGYLLTAWGYLLTAWGYLLTAWGYLLTAWGCLLAAWGYLLAGCLRAWSRASRDGTRRGLLVTGFTGLLLRPGTLAVIPPVIPAIPPGSLRIRGCCDHHASAREQH